MTMPTLMNCPHCPDGWCLACVQELARTPDIVAVCGGRDYADELFVFETLDDAHAENPILLLIEGGADGADKLAREWADARGVPRLTAHALWHKYGKPAGPRRNTDICRAKPKRLYAFPGGSGTADMCRQARYAGIDVLYAARQLRRSVTGVPSSGE